jgi:ketosteroid isomerase-like protein
MNDSTGPAPTAIIARLTTAFDRHDAALLEDLLAEECVLHTVGPAPTGGQVTGRAACRKHWAAVIENESIRFIVEDEFSADATVVQQWRCVDQHEELIQRGVNIYTVHDGLISSAHGYVKANA